MEWIILALFLGAYAMYLNGNRSIEEHALRDTAPPPTTHATKNLGCVVFAIIGLGAVFIALTSPFVSSNTGEQFYLVDVIADDASNVVNDIGAEWEQRNSVGQPNNWIGD